MSVLGLGVDIVEIDRMKLALERTPRIKERIFSQDERWYCEHKAKPYVHYAMRFAAKEAVRKALGTGFSGMRFCDVEVVREGNGLTPKLSGRAAERAAELGVVEMHLSLSFTHLDRRGIRRGDHRGRAAPQGRAARSQGAARGLVQGGAGVARRGCPRGFGRGFGVSFAGGLTMRSSVFASVRESDVPRTDRR